MNKPPMRKAYALYTILIFIAAAAVFNIVVLFAVVQSGLVRIEIGPKLEPPTVEDVMDVHARMLEMEKSIAAKEAQAKADLAAAEAAKSQIEIDRQSLDADKAAMSRDIEGKIAALKSERETLKVVRGEFEEKRLKQLAKMYEGMKPREAVKVFENMDIRTVGDVLARMKTRNSAKIIEKMRPEMASYVSEMLKTGAPKKSAVDADAQPSDPAKK